MKFEEIFAQYYHRIHRFLLRLSGNESTADELTQEVFYLALLHIDQYKETGNMYTWLCTIGKNAWLNEIRWQKRIIPLAESHYTILDESPGLEESALRNEQKNALREAILSLPEEYRDVLILHVYSDIPLREISIQKGKSESWGKVTFYRAKQMLARKMEEFK